MKSETNTERATGKPRRSRPVRSARDKSLAVLTVWAGKRRAGAVCRELGVSWGILNQWEKQALRGMLEGLGQREEPGDQAMNLGPRLERLIQGLDRQPEPTPETPVPIESLPTA